MTRNCTQHDLIRIMYGDLGTDSYTSVYSNLDLDLESREELESMRRVKNSLPKVSFEPSEASIQRILNFSRMTALVTHLN